MDSHAGPGTIHRGDPERPASLADGPGGQQPGGAAEPGRDAASRRVSRPKRYPRDPRLSSMADQLQAMEEELAADDWPNADRLRQARNLIVDVAMGVKRG